MLGIKYIITAPGHYQKNGQPERKIREHKTALRNITNCQQSNWLIFLLSVAAYTNAGYSDTLTMSPYRPVYGRDYPLLDIYKTQLSAVPVVDNYYNQHQEVHNAAYQVLNLAHFRTSKMAPKRRNPKLPVEVRGLIIVFGDQFATKSEYSRKLQSS